MRRRCSIVFWDRGSSELWFVVCSERRSPDDGRKLPQLSLTRLFHDGENLDGHWNSSSCHEPSWVESRSNVIRSPRFQNAMSELMSWLVAAARRRLNVVDKIWSTDCGRRPTLYSINARNVAAAQNYLRYFSGYRPFWFHAVQASQFYLLRFIWRIIPLTENFSWTEERPHVRSMSKCWQSTRQRLVTDEVMYEACGIHSIPPSL